MSDLDSERNSHYEYIWSALQVLLRALVRTGLFCREHMSTTNFSHPEKLKTSFLHIFVRHVTSLSSIYAAWEMKFIRNCLLELLDDTLIHFISLLQCLIFGWILWGWWVLIHAHSLFEVTEFVFNYCNSQVSWQHHWPHAFIQT